MKILTTCNNVVPMTKLIILLLIFITHNATAQLIPDTLDVCIDYHCEKRQQVNIKADEWLTILRPFQQTGSNAQQEREQIRESIALFEQIVGRYTPTFQDQAENRGEDKTGQLDCIAESTNTQHYLQWLAAKNLLKWHRVAKRVKRSPHFFDVHWGAQIIEKNRQTAYVVDSWHGANGDKPDVQMLKEWLNP